MGRTLNQNNSNKGGNNSVIGTNPVIRKLSKVAEQSDNCGKLRRNCRKNIVLSPHVGSGICTVSLSFA